MKRYFTYFLFICYALSANAVLKEHDLEQTISVLRSELEYYKQQQDKSEKLYMERSTRQHDQIVNTIQQSEQVALMLYSQKQDYTFDLAYACHEATTLYDEFSHHQIPYQKILDNYELEIDRYTHIIEVLKKMPPRKADSTDLARRDSLRKTRLHVRMDTNGEIDTMSTEKMLEMAVDSLQKKQLPFKLSMKAQCDRDSCIALATDIRESYINLFNAISEDSEHYTSLNERLKQLNDYAITRYTDIKQLIFQNGDDTYFTILKRLPFYLELSKNDIINKYLLPGKNGVHSEWSGPIVFGFAFFIIFYITISYILCRLIIRFAVPAKFKTKNFEQKENYYIIAASVLIFAIVLFVLRCFMHHNFFLMASKLLIEYACLISAVLFSLLIRVKGNQIASSTKIYVPILVMGFIIIVFRIIFISNTLVNVFFPPILLFFTIWQWMVVHKHNKNIPFSDIAYTYISLAVITTSCIASWVGYTLLSVQIFIWWLFQLTAIQAITCSKDLVQRYEKSYISMRLKKKQESLPQHKQLQENEFNKEVEAILHPTKKTLGDHLATTWLYDLVTMTLIPVASVLSVLICLYMAAGIFDLTETCEIIFKENFVNVEGFCQLSLQKIVAVAVLFYLFKFINYVAKASYKHYRLKHSSNGEEANITLANNIISILTWGSDFIIILILLHIPKSGISVVTAGLATGIGFAMKDILENFFYGMSLMTGRIRVGDYIECDGIRGKVESITYQSTQILTLDGNVMAFLNSSLFNKNFKNLTKNHGYELVKLEIGVGYNTKIEQAREVILKALESLKAEQSADKSNSLDANKTISVLVSNLSESSVDLYVVLWVYVEDKFRITGMAKELIYDALNEAQIEIPFPQRTVYIKQ